MHTEGVLSPETESAAREWHQALGPAAQTVVREIARAMSFDRDEYQERVTSEVVATAQDALFATLLMVHVGTREDFKEWREKFDGEVSEVGSENVSGVVWHTFGDQCVAATYEQEADAAMATLRRQAYGQLYRDRL